MANAFDRAKCLQELENLDLGEPDFQSDVVLNVHRLHRVPLREFTVEDLRLMIGQQQGLQYLIPIALEHLENEPFVAGDCYEGDLLGAVLLADSRFWIGSPELRAQAEKIAQRAFSLLPTLEEIERQTAEDVLRGAYDVFRRADYFAQHGRSF